MKYSRLIAPFMAIGVLMSSCANSTQDACGSQCCAKDSSTTIDKGAIVIENIMTRRSIRKYKPQPVGRDTVETIVRCGINAPNGMNRQPWEIRIVDSPEYIDGITALCREKDDRMGKDSTMVTMFRNAYTVIFVGAQNNANLDCGIMGENMVLAAWGMGLGTCFLGGPIAFMKNTPECKPYLDKLGFSEGTELIYAIAVGYPDENPDAKSRDESKWKFVD